MSLFFWNNRYEIGIPQIDEHHRHILHLLNMLYDMFITSADTETAGNLLDELIDYTIYHFYTEERWMHDHGYPKSQLHMLEHDEFSRHINLFYDDFCKGKAFLSVEILTFLHTWLATHIIEQDAELGRFHKQGDRMHLFEEDEPKSISIS